MNKNAHVLSQKTGNHTEMHAQNITCLGVVLAGGLSSRMGQDKSQLQRKNQDMLKFSQQLLTDSGIEHIVVSGDKHPIPDLIPQAGPVGGIYSVLRHFSTLTQPKALLILPVDLPLMTAKALKKLRLTGELSQKATYFTDTQGHAHNIPLYLPNSSMLELFLAQAFQSLGTQTVNANKKHGPSIKALLKQVPNQSLQLDDSLGKSTILFNSNTPQDWQQAKQHFTL